MTNLRSATFRRSDKSFVVDWVKSPSPYEKKVGQVMASTSTLLEAQIGPSRPDERTATVHQVSARRTPTVQQ
jgi:hypothetical protein